MVFSDVGVRIERFMCHGMSCGASNGLFTPVNKIKAFAISFTLYHGPQRSNKTPVLAMALVAEQPSPQSLHQLEHEDFFAAELDPAWTAKPRSERGCLRARLSPVKIPTAARAEPLWQSRQK
jgi:hypothetical protein